MTIPMIVLAFGSVFAGGFFAIGDRFVSWLEPVTGYDHGHSPLSAATVTGATVVALLVGVGIAWAMYGRKPVPVVAPRGSVLTRAARRDLLQDDFNHVVLVRGGEHLTRSLVYVDHSLVDGVVNGTAASVGGLSGRMRKLQNGYARTYAVSMFGGTAVVIAATLLMRAVWICTHVLSPPDRDGGAPGDRRDRHRRRPRRAAHRGQMARAALLAGHARPGGGRLPPLRAGRRPLPAHRPGPGSPTSASATNWASTASGWRCWASPRC
ncbi:hypothetical protein SCALM49S_08875 [Streptomyces californicus]